jgi:ABC-type transporter Mla MlaB component
VTVRNRKLPPLAVRTVRDHGALRITRTINPPGLAISGDIDEFTYSGLLSALADIAGEAAEIHVDMARVQYCDLAGLRAIIALTRTSGYGQEQRGRRVVLDGIPPQLRAVLGIVGWDATPGLALQVRVPAARRPESAPAALLPAGDGRVHLPQQDLGWLGSGDLLPAGRRESHRIALRQGAGILKSDGSPRDEQVQERGLRKLDHLAGSHPGGM